MPHFESIPGWLDGTMNQQTSYRDQQVKGRVVTTMVDVQIQIGIGYPRPGFEVKQVIDGVVTSYKTFSTKLEAAEEYAMLRAHARRNLHEYLSSVAPETFTERTA